MELKAGYKLTEVGVIPEDWEVTKLGRKATFKTGPFGSTLHQSDYVDDGIPVINPMQIVDGKIQPTPSMAITEQMARKLFGFRLAESDVVIGRRGDMGRCAFVQKDEHGWLCGTGSMIIRTKPSLDARFIQRVLSSPPVIAAIENTSVGSTMINLNQGTLWNLLFSLPPTKAEQEAIAEVLSDTDALIESLEQLIAKKSQIKQGAMQELLRQKDGWVEHSLPAVCWFQEGPGVRNSQFTISGVKLFNGTNIEKGKINLDKTSRFIAESEAYGWYSHFLADVGDIVIACSGVSVDKFEEKVSEIEPEHLPLCMNTSTMRFKIQAEIINKQYLKYFLRSNLFKQQISGKATGSAQLNFGPSHVSEVKIWFPNLKEQCVITTILSDMDTEITALETKLTKTRQIKQGMMAELLTGQIRLV